MKNMRNGLEKKELIYRICFIMLLVWGVILTFMVPQWQTPDEYAHLQMIGESLKNDGLADSLIWDMEMDNVRIRLHPEKKVDMVTWREAMTAAPDYERKDCLPGGVKLSVLKHFPAAIGILLGILFHLPTFWVLELGELCSLLFFLLIGVTALRLMPVKKEVLLIFMAFPMTMQQAASISYDSVLLPLCFLFIAYIFYLRYTKERLGWKEAGITLLLLLLIVYIKVPYVFFGLLVFLLPADKICLRIGKFEINGVFIRKWRPVGIVLLLLLIVLAVFAVRDNFWVRLVGGMLLEFKRSLYLLKSTVVTCGWDLFVSSVGQFGWLEVSVPKIFAFFSYILLLFLAVWGETEESPYALRCRSRIFLWAVFIILTGFIIISMVNHTIMVTQYGSENLDRTYELRKALYEIPYIGGLQGRYFLPFLSIPFLALPAIKKKTEIWGRQRMPEDIRENYKAYLSAVYIVLAAVLTIVILCRRYWI